MANNMTFDKATLPLLVPVNIEALIVGRENTTWVDMSLKFDGIAYNDFLSRNLQAEPCTNTTSDLLKPGIHLHWALPDALCHGEAKGTGEPSRFPPIPNRWLVVRVWSPDKNSPAIKFRAWIIESDTVVTDDASSATQWPALEAERPTCIRVGRFFDLAQGPGETPQVKVSINALGYGDPAFAANYTASKGILGFHDCDPDLDDLGNKELAYFVSGWYDDADPVQDPLHRSHGKEDLDTFDTLASILGQSRWFYPGFDALAEKVGRVRELERKISEADDMLKRINDVRANSSPVLAESAHSRQLSAGENALPDHIAGLEAEQIALSKEISGLLPALPGRVLCHGAITGFDQWTNKDALYDNGVPHLNDQTFKLAVGNTTVEALAALLQNNLGNELAELLGAFQYDLLSELEQPCGDDILQRKLHERTFSPIVRGIRWDLSQAGTQTPPDSPAGSSPPIPGDISDLLEALNRSQREINRLIREKRWLQSELYAMWYKKVLNFPDNTFVDGNIIEESLTKLDQEIRRLSGKISEKIDPLTKAPRGPEWAELQDKIATLLPGYDLLKLEEAPFWRPNDPVLLLAGPPFKSSPRHGEDGRFRLDGRLLCRVLGQQISSIKITIANAVKKDVEFGISEVNQWFDLSTLSKAASLPNGIIELFREFLLITMNAKRAENVASVAFEKNGNGFSKQYPDSVKTVKQQLLNYFEELWREAQEEPKAEIRGPRRSYNDTVFDLAGEFPSPVMINEWQDNPWLPLYLQWQAEWTPDCTDAPSALNGWKLNEAGTGFERERDAPESSNEPPTFSGSTLLTSGATINLADRLRQYNLSHANTGLEELRTRIVSYDLLGQNLGGFTDQLLMRKGLLELLPMDRTDSGPQFSTINDSVRDIDWLSPITEGALLPVRAGHLSFKKLWVIDAFGRVLKLEDHVKLDSPCLPPRMMASNGRIKLEPRLAQSARLAMEWTMTAQLEIGGRNAGEQGIDTAYGAVCGWIIPNFLDAGLMIYDAGGTALGALQSVLRKSWSEGFGGIQPEMESFHWVDIPSSKTFLFGQPPKPTLDPLGDKANPHLRQFVNALLGLKGGSGARLMENINRALSTGGGNLNPNLAMLIGRPLALVRASLSLEVEGRPALAQAWNDLSKNNTGGIEQLKIPVRLGDRQLKNGVWQGSDGLAGFFLKADGADHTDYSHFYPAFGLGNPRQNDEYNVYQKVPDVALAHSLDLTLLMEPSKGVCATTGILPRTVFHLPSGGAIDILENKEVIFYTGPLLTTAREIRMPHPSDSYGQWSWTHHPEVKVWLEESITDSQKEQGRFFDEPFQIAEGWLKLITAPLSIRSFGIEGKNPIRETDTSTDGNIDPVPDRFELPADKQLILFWEVVGAVSIELQQDGKTILKSSRPPLPSRYRLNIAKNTSFTLIATGRVQKKPKPLTKTIMITAIPSPK